MNQQSTCLQSDIETLIRSGPPTVLLDANVLVPQYLRAVLLELAEARLFRPHWSKHILEEVRRNLAGLQSRYRLPTERVDRLLALMQTSFPDATVTGYERLETSFAGLTDPKDQHVEAAALHLSRSAPGQTAVVLVTQNTRDLPQRAFTGTPVLATRPDAFLQAMLAIRPAICLATLSALCKRLRRPPMKRATLLAVLENAGCASTALSVGKLWKLVRQGRPRGA